MIKTLTSGTFNIPKFFEWKLVFDDNGTVEYAPTVMNEDKSYITWSSWWDELIVTGVVPFLALVIFNSKIYLKLRESDRQEYRFVGRKEAPSQGIPRICTTTVHREHVVDTCPTIESPYISATPSNTSLEIKKGW